MYAPRIPCGRLAGAALSGRDLYAELGIVAESVWKDPRVGRCVLGADPERRGKWFCCSVHTGGGMDNLGTPDNERTPGPPVSYPYTEAA